ncbi:MAG: 7-cyano-7-deazaguanine synthase QueC [Nitrospirae bacterium]|nr:7-cyano-7-deazaguanine synthase QueC [Nitrospirota bacterium]
MPKAVVLLSGGVDSTTTLAVAKSECYEVSALSFDYNQRHRIELEAAKKVAASLGIKNHLIVNFDLREIGGSALTADIEVPKTSAEAQKRGSAKAEKGSLTSELLNFSPQASRRGDRTSELIPVTYVPARNTIFLSFALAWAEVLEAEDIFIGANAVDYSGYPDCRPEYLKAFEKMANLATKASVEGKMRFKINAPLINLTKAEIIKKGIELGLDYSLTWSCYDPQPKIPPHPPLEKGGGRDLKPCGQCDSCIFRAKGFKEAGIKDSLIGC